MKCLYEDSSYPDYLSRDFIDVRISLKIHLLNEYFANNQIIKFEQDGKVKLLDHLRLKKVISAILDKCLFFLNDVITELQYGGTVELLMEEIRKSTDEKLANIDINLRNETQSLYLNLVSSNPADWNKVAHSCRKILTLLADQVFPAKNETYQMKDGRQIKVANPQYINRLCAFLDQKVKSDERRFLISELEYFESYLRQIVDYAQMGEHKPSIEKFHADMIAIHTYLISSEILKNHN